MKKYLKNERGFTLIEILAVIIILGVIATIGIPSVLEHVENSKVNSEMQSMLVVKDAAKRWLLDNGKPGTAMTTSDCKAAFIPNYLDATWPEKLDGTDIECSIATNGTITVTGSTTNGTITGK